MKEIKQKNWSKKRKPFDLLEWKKYGQRNEQSDHGYGISANVNVVDSLTKLLNWKKNQT